MTVAAMLTLQPAGPRAPNEAERTPHVNPTAEDITRALAIVKRDPNLAEERRIKTLKWNASSDRKPWSVPSWLTWIAGLFDWLGQSTRILVWGAMLALTGALGVYLLRTFQAARLPVGASRLVAPTHVRDLDIRPETLPRDLGAAARSLWDAGEHRAALSLLYRGLLSRLTHVHGLPIRDSTTEGDCLSLATGRLPLARREYVSQLVGVWQRYVYGGTDVQTAIVHRLCDGFAGALDASRGPEPSGQEAAG